MWLTSFLGFLRPAWSGTRAGRRRRLSLLARRRPGLRLALEQLEDRTLPSNFTAATVSRGKSALF
jgi:hypothetical protein